MEKFAKVLSKIDTLEGLFKFINTCQRKHRLLQKRFKCNDMDPQEFRDKSAEIYSYTEYAKKNIDYLSDKGVFLSKVNIFNSYYTFNEMYDLLKMYNAALFNEWARCSFSDSLKYDIHKSWKHHDDKLCFGGSWFIVVASLPTGNICQYYKAQDWDLFNIPEEPNAKHAFELYTWQDVLECLKSIL